MLLIGRVRALLLMIEVPKKAASYTFKFFCLLLILECMQLNTLYYNCFLKMFFAGKFA